MLGDPVARRYGRALFNAAGERGRLDAVGADLDAVARFLRTDIDARRLLRAAPISTEERQQVVRRLFAAMLDPLVLELLLLLLEKKRFELLVDVAQDFRERHEHAHGILRVEVVSAVPLAEAAARRLAEVLGARTGKQVRLERRVDAGLIGGLRVRIGDQVIERSIRRGLETIRRALREAAFEA